MLFKTICPVNYKHYLFGIYYLEGFFVNGLHGEFGESPAEQAEQNLDRLTWTFGVSISNAINQSTILLLFELFDLDFFILFWFFPLVCWIIQTMNTSALSLSVNVTHKLFIVTAWKTQAWSTRTKHKPGESYSSHVLCAWSSWSEKSLVRIKKGMHSLKNLIRSLQKCSWLQNWYYMTYCYILWQMLLSSFHYLWINICSRSWVVLSWLSVVLVGGYAAHSLAIMTDAAHLLTDFGSVLISLFSLWISSRPPSKHLTFGWHRSGVCVCVCPLVCSIYRVQRG